MSNTLDSLKAGETYRLLVTLVGRPVKPGDRVRVTFTDAGSVRCRKEIHAGDPDFYLPYRPSRDGTHASPWPDRRSPTASPDRPLDWARMSVDASDRAAIEAEPNDSWQQANELRAGPRRLRLGRRRRLSREPARRASRASTGSGSR